MSYFIEITNDLSKLTHYDDIKKVSDLSNSILKNGIDHSYEEKNLEVTFDDVKIELTPERSNRPLSVDIFEFFDYVTKQKRLVFIYSLYKELKQFESKFENKKNGLFRSYNVMLKEENDKLFFKKELFFNKDKLLKYLIKENDNKNVIFLKYQGKIYPIKLQITKAFFKKTKDKVNQKFPSFLSKVLFPTPLKLYLYLIVKYITYADWKSYAIFITPSISKILAGGVDLYFSPELYAKNNSFMKDFKETREVNVDEKTLQLFLTQLKDQSYNVSKIYGFRNLFMYSNIIMKEEHVILPDFNIHVKLKDQLLKELFKKTIESSYFVLESDTKVKTLPPSDIENLSGQFGYIKNLSKKVNLKSLTHTNENFFLYDLENIIKPTFATDVQKECSIYELISFTGETKKKNNNKADLIK